MNSRQRRKLAAQEHNDRIGLLFDLRQVRAAIYAKHDVWVPAVIDDSNESVRREITRLRGVFTADVPPARASRPTSEQSRGRGQRVYAGVALAALAGLSQ